MTDIDRIASEWAAKVAAATQSKARDKQQPTSAVETMRKFLDGSACLRDDTLTDDEQRFQRALSKLPDSLRRVLIVKHVAPQILRGRRFTNKALASLLKINPHLFATRLEMASEQVLADEFQ